jgi:hypothetical protein
MVGGFLRLVENERRLENVGCGSRRKQIPGPRFVNQLRTWGTQRRIGRVIEISRGEWGWTLFVQRCWPRCWPRSGPRCAADLGGLLGHLFGTIASVGGQVKKGGRGFADSE